MPKFGNRSKNNLITCETQLQRLLKEVIKHRDCSVLCGHRDQVAQDIAFNAGNSKLRFPLSRHNRFPSKAVDVVPYPIDWNDLDRFKAFGNFVKGVAVGLGIKIAWGGDWKSFKDYPHFELVD